MSLFPRLPPTGPDARTLAQFSDAFALTRSQPAPPAAPDPAARTRAVVDALLGIAAGALRHRRQERTPRF